MVQGNSYSNKNTKPTDRTREIAVVDLGSNSFHMIITRIVNDIPQIIDRIKQRIHLADGLDEQNYLTEKAINRGLACLSLFAKRLQHFPKENIRVIATHTLRQAKNASSFIKQAEKVFPYPIEIISGQEEARLIYIGIAQSQPEKGKKLAIDIGGGSTELVIGEGFNPILTESRPMGCVTYTKRFFPDHQINENQFIQARLAAEQQLENITPIFVKTGWKWVFGSSGSVKTINNILIEMMGLTDNIITLDRLQHITNHVLQFKNFNSLDIPGLSTERKDIFLAGLAILTAIFNMLKIEELHLSPSSLREGVLFEMENGQFRTHDIRSRTAINLTKHYRINQEQAQRVLNTTRILYQQWAEQNPSLTNPQLEELLHWAALLHEVGLPINFSNIQKHSAYILQYSNLPGFNQEQQLVLSTFVRFHRHSLKLENIPDFYLFSKQQILPLILILRLAVLMNRQQQSANNYNDLKLISQKNTFALHFSNDTLIHNPLLQLDLSREQKYWHNIPNWTLCFD